MKAFSAPVYWIALIRAFLPTQAVGQTPEPWAALRHEMVAREVVEAGVRDPRIIEAMSQTPRHLFVGPKDRRLAYFDMALPIGAGQTISPPFVVAYMTEQLAPQPTDRVLEIGTGSGYQAAVLSPLVAEVYSIEIVESLAKKAKAVLAAQKYSNIKTKAGDGYLGWPEFAPFDKIIVTCSPEAIPQALVDQLKEGGRLVIPLGERFQQSLYLYEKKSGVLDRKLLEATFFVPMTGEAELRRKKTTNQPFTPIVNGDFELFNEREEPEGWYYVRQCTSVEDPQAPDGKRVLRLHNVSPGRHAQALQAIGVDGRLVKQILLKFSFRTQDVSQGQSEQQLPHLQVAFYDDKRSEVGRHRIGPWSGTADWTHPEERISVPPKSRLAVFMLGMFGAVGEVRCDALSIAARKP